jgi:hypothetical protein
MLMELWKDSQRKNKLSETHRSGIQLSYQAMPCLHLPKSTKEDVFKMHLSLKVYKDWSSNIDYKLIQPSNSNDVKNEVVQYNQATCKKKFMSVFFLSK